MEEDNNKIGIVKISKRNKSIPHIIPKFYLDFFCNNNKITVFSKKTKPYSSSPYKIAKETKYYSLEKVPDYHRELADAILTDTEGVVKNTHHKLIDSNLNITPTEKNNYATFLWFLFCRTKTFRKIINDQYFKIICEQTKRLAYDKNRFSKGLKNRFKEEDIEKVRNIALNNKIREHCKMEMDKDTLIYDMVAIGSNKKHIETLAKMNWTTIITTQNHPFITSDHPVSIFNAKYNFDLNEKDTNITIPLNSGTCLMLSWRFTLPVIHPANVSNHSEIVMSINRRTLDGAYEQVYVGLTNIPIQGLLKEFGFIIQ